MSEVVEIKWMKLNHLAQIPQYASSGAAAFDMHAALEKPLTINKGEITLIPTGLACEIPPGYELQIRARSGLAAKFGFTLVNGVGTIDSDYRGEIKVIATLLVADSLVIEPGDRVCQGLVAPVMQVVHRLVNDLNESKRGQGGFGSTGVGAQK